MLSLDRKSSKLKICFVFSFFIFLVPNLLLAQRYEVGAAIGGGNYRGDINPSFRFENYRPAGGIFGRYNFGYASSAKIFINGVQSKGYHVASKDPFSKLSNTSFIRTVLEFGGQFEYNFFNYRDEKSRRNWTPYFLVGFSGMYMFDAHNRSRNRVNRLQPVIPAGVGLKYMIGSKWNLGIEVAARKLFTDYFDHTSFDEEKDPQGKGNEHTKDWYFISTISLSYTFYSIPCPFDKYN